MGTPILVYWGSQCAQPMGMSRSPSPLAFRLENGDSTQLSSSLRNRTSKSSRVTKSYVQNCVVRGRALPVPFPTSLGQPWRFSIHLVASLSADLPEIPCGGRRGLTCRRITLLTIFDGKRRILSNTVAALPPEIMPSPVRSRLAFRHS